MQDRFEHHSPGISAPASRAVAIAPSDEAALPFIPRAVYIGGAGDLATRTADGGEVVWKNLPAGSFLPFRPTMILAAGTTATNVLVLD